MGPRCSSAKTQVCHRSYIIAARRIQLQQWKEAKVVVGSHQCRTRTLVVFEEHLDSLKQDEDFNLHITEKALALSQPNLSLRLGKVSQTSSPMFRHMAAIYTLYIYQYVY